MTAAEFRASLKAHGLSQRSFMRLVQALADSSTPDVSMINRWATGRAGVPAPVAALLACWSMVPYGMRGKYLDAVRRPRRG